MVTGFLQLITMIALPTPPLYLPGVILQNIWLVTRWCSHRIDEVGEKAHLINPVLLTLLYVLMTLPLQGRNPYDGGYKQVWSLPWYRS
jgi:hypothetical protein